MTPGVPFLGKLSIGLSTVAPLSNKYVIQGSDPSRAATVRSVA